MSSSTRHFISLAYEHDGQVRQASAELVQKKIRIIFNGLPSMKFEISHSDPGQVTLQLPTDRGGKKPTVGCEISSIPELEAAVEEMRRQGWLTPKVIAKWDE